jgi:hypothetical protein
MTITMDGMSTELTDEEWAALFTERWTALGQLTEVAASMEWSVRLAFCALVDSKYAAVIAGGRSLNDLIEDCIALVNVHHRMTLDQRKAIKDALTECSEASKLRNTLIHGMKSAMGADGRFFTSKSLRRKHRDEYLPWTAATVRGPPHGRDVPELRMPARNPVKRNSQELWTACPD